jgi:hypothetical protein
MLLDNTKKNLEIINSSICKSNPLSHGKLLVMATMDLVTVISAMMSTILNLICWNISSES